MREYVDPPALVRPAADELADLGQKVDRTYRRTQEDRQQIRGWLLRAREIALPDHRWGAWLAERTIPRTTAFEWMEEQSNKPPDNSGLFGSEQTGQSDSVDIGVNTPGNGDLFAEERPYPDWPEGGGDAENRKSAVKLPYVTVAAWKEMDERKQLRTLQVKQTDDRFNAQGDNENIEWALWSWNPVTGCLHNCPYCYARDIANRFYEQKFEPTLHPGRLWAPRNTPFPEAKAAEWVGHKNVFTCSMADLFGRWVPREWIDAVLEQVRAAPQWNFLFLTKFPIRMAEFKFPDNAWVGTTVDCQARVANAEKAFRKVKAAVKWLSIEPMIEPLRFSDLGAFQWAVIGGSSRSAQTPEWRVPTRWWLDLEEQAEAVGVAVYHKANLYRRKRGYHGSPDHEPTEAPEPLRYLPADKGAP